WIALPAQYVKPHGFGVAPHVDGGAGAAGSASEADTVGAVSAVGWSTSAAGAPGSLLTTSTFGSAVGAPASAESGAASAPTANWPGWSCMKLTVSRAKTCMS